jgi:HSP20 family protein
MGEERDSGIGTTKSPTKPAPGKTIPSTLISNHSITITMYRKHHTTSGASGCGPAFKGYGSSYYSKFGGGPRGGYYRRPKYNVPINIVEKESHYEVHVYALGFAKENIRLSVVDDVLYISGTRTIDESNPPNFSRQEYPVKSFERMVSLNEKVDKASISARQEEGVLIVTLPKTSQAQQSDQEIKID